MVVTQSIIDDPTSLFIGIVENYTALEYAVLYSMIHSG
jgi:hypothetical protein